MLRRRDVLPRARVFRPILQCRLCHLATAFNPPSVVVVLQCNTLCKCTFSLQLCPCDRRHLTFLRCFTVRSAEGGLQTNVMPVLNSQRKFALPKTRETIQENWHCGRLSYPKRHSCDNRKISHVNTVTFPLLSNAVGYPPRQIANEGRTSHWEVHSAFGRSGLSNSESCGA